MIALIIASFELSGAWIVPTFPAPVKDINNQIITLGSKVKLVGTVTSLNTSTNVATFTLDHPSNQPPIGQLSVQFNGNNLVLGV